MPTRRRSTDGVRTRLMGQLADALAPGLAPDDPKALRVAAEAYLAARRAGKPNALDVAEQVYYRVEAGLSRDEVDPAIERALAKAKEHCPPIPVRDGLVEMEPTLRCMATRLDLDPDEVVREVDRALEVRDLVRANIQRTARGLP